MSDDQLTRQKAEFTDHQHELAGIGHKQSKHFDEKDTPRGRHARDAKGNAAQILSALDQLRLDPVYAAAWTRANETLDTFQDTLTKRSDELAQRIEHLQDLVEELERSTAKTADGQLVFRNADGKLVDKDGAQLSPAITALLLNPEDAQSYEQYRGAQDALNNARQKQDRLSDMQRNVQDWKDRLNDPDNPMTIDEMDELAEKAKKYEAEVDTLGSSKSAFNNEADSIAAPTTNTNDIVVKPIAL